MWWTIFGGSRLERWVLAPLRHRRFFSLVELNAAIAEQTRQLNSRPKRLGAHPELSGDPWNHPVAVASLLLYCLGDHPYAPVAHLLRVPLG